MTRAGVPLTRFRIPIESTLLLKRAAVVLLLVGASFACEERFTGAEQAGGGTSAGGSSAGTGSGTGGSSTTGGASGVGGSGGSPVGGASSGGTETGGTTSGGASGGWGADGGEGGEPGEVAPPVPTEGLLLWLRADRGVKQVEGRVVEWEDGSSSGNDALQTADNAQPAFVTEAFGGRPAVAFGENQFMRLPAGFSDFSKGLSAFAVGSFEEMTTCTAVFHLGNGPEVDDIELGQWMGDYLYEVGEQYPVSDLFAFDTPALMALVHRPTTSVEMRWNQDLAANPTVPLPAAVERADNVLGKSLYPDCSSMNGKLAELILYDRAVSDQELVAIEDYLQQRYACCD